MQSEHGRQQRDYANDGHGQEDRAPAVGIGLPAAQGGADGWRHAHGHAHRAHGKPAARQRVNGEHGDLQHRPHHARAGSFEHAPDQHPYEVWPQPCQHGAECEHRHRADDDLAGGEASGQKRGQRHHHAHDQLEHGGEPLPGGYGDVEFGNDNRQRGTQLQLREVAHEGDEGQYRDGDERRPAEFAVYI